jgi:hypothetical protein
MLPAVTKGPIKARKNAMEKFLPTSVSDFPQMITGNFVYVDKTRYIYDLVRVPQAYYFLSRPRRFGKSLLVSTLGALFEGKKELFKGLWIENSGWPWKPHPVVKIDFSEIALADAQVLAKSLLLTLDQIAQQHNLALKSNLLPNQFAELILALAVKFHETVVILVDEYDKPIISHLGKGHGELQIAKEIREVLKSFFGVLKGANVSANLRFVFFTGISKFSKVSIFSDLNNLQELTMHEAYAGLLGYTQEELETCFGDWIAALAESQQTSQEEILQKLRQWYNGYQFTKKNLRVYNPYSILNVFAQRDFKSFWFETATPSFLVNLIKEKNYPLSQIESMEVHELVFSTYELENLAVEALLFQTGYTTILGYDGTLFRLGYPNQEVKTSFMAHLYHNLVEIIDTTLKAQFSRLQQYLAQDEIEKFIATTNAILAAIPYTQIHSQAAPEMSENYYHTVFYLMVAASGVLVHTEVLSAHGRMDMAVEFKDKVFVIELKCNQSAAQAIRQIHEKRYHEKYLQSGRKIYLLGINFSTKDRAIADWRLELVGH